MGRHNEDIYGIIIGFYFLRGNPFLKKGAPSRSLTKNFQIENMIINVMPNLIIYSKFLREGCGEGAFLKKHPPRIINLYDSIRNLAVRDVCFDGIAFVYLS